MSKELLKRIAILEQAQAEFLDSGDAISKVTGRFKHGESVLESVKRLRARTTELEKALKSIADAKSCGRVLDADCSCCAALGEVHMRALAALRGGVK